MLFTTDKELRTFTLIYKNGGKEMVELVNLCSSHKFFFRISTANERVIVVKAFGQNKVGYKLNFLNEDDSIIEINCEDISKITSLLKKYDVQIKEALSNQETIIKQGNNGK